MQDSAAPEAEAAGRPRIGVAARAFSPHEFLELVRASERDALAALAHATGDASVCALPRAGAARPVVKSHEGAASALAGVRRILTSRPGTSPVDAVAAARADWEDNAPLAVRGPDWAAYYAGGVAALDLLAETMAAANRDRPAPRPEDVRA